MQKEHDVISDMLDVFEKMLSQLDLDESLVTNEDLQQVLAFFVKYTDVYHHAKEEELLFPAADKQGIVTQQGGPKCSLFYGMFTENNSLNHTLADVAAYKQDLPVYSAKPCVQQLIDKNSPLKVPLSEHEVGHYSVQLMKAEVGQRIETSDWDKALFLKVAYRFIQMLRGHIRKEDECLFLALKQSFSTEVALECSKKFEDFNNKNIELNNWAVSTLAHLSKKYSAERLSNS